VEQFEQNRHQLVGLFKVFASVKAEVGTYDKIPIFR